MAKCLLVALIAMRLGKAIFWEVRTTTLTPRVAILCNCQEFLPFSNIKCREGLRDDISVGYFCVIRILGTSMTSRPLGQTLRAQDLGFEFRT